MKKILIILISISSVLYTHAQIEKLAGPRVGAVLITPGISSHWINGERGIFDDVSPTINDDAKAAFISLYGWQWESRFADGGNITGIVEWIALIGGARTANGIEFAVGPNLSLNGIAMVLGAGYNIKSGKLNIPVNIAFVPNMKRKEEAEWVWDYDQQMDVWQDEFEYNTGARLSITFGFNLNREEPTEKK